jgi:hypothetical protein
MTAEKPQRHAHRRNGNFNRTLSGKVRGASGGTGSLAGAHFDSRVEAAPARGPFCVLRPAQGKLAGFGGAASAEIQSPAAPVPIWFAALQASHCQAKARGEGRAVRWNCVSGRAVYTNCGQEEETIEPLGVRLEGGHTVAVSWTPGATTYTMEVFRQFDCVV